MNKTTRIVLGIIIILVGVWITHTRWQAFVAGESWVSVIFFGPSIIVVGIGVARGVRLKDIIGGGF